MNQAQAEFSKELLAGGVAGMMGLFVGYPMDTIKVHQQVSGKKMGDACIDIIQYQGFRGFFRGMAVPLITYGGVFAVFFASSGSVLDYMVYQDGRRASNPGIASEELATYKEIFISGAIGGAVQGIPAAPVELLKIQMQIGGKKKSPNVMRTIKKLIRLRGYRGFGIGMGATLLRDVHSHGIYSLGNKIVLDGICGGHGASGSKPSPFCQFIAGGIAGTLYWWTCIPADAVKSRIQGDSLSKPIYKNTWDCILKTYTNEGYKPFIRGTWAITLRAFPSNGCIFLCHNEIGKWLGQYM